MIQINNNINYFKNCITLAKKSRLKYFLSGWYKSTKMIKVDEVVKQFRSQALHI